VNLLISGEMGEFRFADRINVKSDFKKILMIEDIAAIENKGGFSHGLKNFFVI
jgi:hypothetical protein